MPEDQPRPYRVRIFEGAREVLKHRPSMVILDLTPGPPLEEARLQLNTLLRTLIKADNAKRENVPHYYLDVRDWETDRQIFTWPVTWDVDTV